MVVQMPLQSVGVYILSFSLPCQFSLSFPCQSRDWAPLVTGWALELVLTAADFTQHPSKTVRSHFFTVLRDAWQTRPAMQVRFLLPLSQLHSNDRTCGGDYESFLHACVFPVC